MSPPPGSSPPVVDCHHHLWDLGRHIYDWLQADPLPDTLIGDYTSICRDYLIDDYLGDARPSGVTKSVHVQCEFDHTNPAGETEWLQHLADEYGFPHGIVGFANLAAPGVEDLLERHRHFPNFRGVRQNLNWDNADPRRSFADRGDYLTDPAWQSGFDLLGRSGLSFDLQILPAQMSAAVDLLRSSPGTMTIIDHAGLPLDRSAATMEQWRAGMTQLAGLPNTAVKLSGFGMMDNQWTVDSIRPIVLEVIELFGTNRCLFASNFPVDSLGGSYGDFYVAYRQIVDSFEPGEQAALFGGNAERIYRL